MVFSIQMMIVELADSFLNLFYFQKQGGAR